MEELAHGVSSDIVVDPRWNADTLLHRVGQVARIQERDDPLGADRTTQARIATTRNNYADTPDSAAVFFGRAFQIRAELVQREVGSLRLGQLENATSRCLHNSASNMGSSDVHPDNKLLLGCCH